MKHFQSTESFTKREDIQVQVNTARIGIVVTLPDGTSLEDVILRVRLVGVGGTKVTVEKITLKKLFEIAASSEGFYTVYPDAVNAQTSYAGHVDIARGGALKLDNRQYLSVDVEALNGKQITSCSLYSIAHPKLTETYLKYNPVTITQSVQNLPVELGVQLVVPLLQVDNVQMQYPEQNIEYSQSELFFIANMMNDLVYVNTKTNTVKAGYDELIVVDLIDPLSAARASKIQVEKALDAGQFNVILIEERTL